MPVDGVLDPDDAVARVRRRRETRPRGEILLRVDVDEARRRHADALRAEAGTDLVRVGGTALEEEL